MPATVLLVDDDGSLTDALLRRLHGEPWRTLSASSGEQALIILASIHVDLMVCDEQMPGMSGVELLTETHRRWPDLVPIMLSGRASTGTVVRALNQGQIHRFLIKPIDGEALAAEIREALVHKLVLDRCRQLLPICRNLKRMLATIEAIHPGILRTVSGGSQPLVVQQDDFRGMDELAEHLAVEIQHQADYLPSTDALERNEALVSARPARVGEARDDQAVG